MKITEPLHRWRSGEIESLQSQLTVVVAVIIIEINVHSTRQHATYFQMCLYGPFCTAMAANKTRIWLRGFAIIYFIK